MFGIIIIEQIFEYVNQFFNSAIISLAVLIRVN